ncbi:ATP-dependent DNA ligase [Curtobacterium caseinilyticum]|uniref:ATP-dependent DNA ligase n=1 Tax=Curtobacterium caseinilyticum TaxID=3055137 RepID=A0ABT7TM28_9MICO|nr:ATP-dependent DNA ligase [Curtobacterium caseinilyticum]MDM7890580.1 ATP-dependent DNA ligase [Curtobacterium caseinilyticum]
MGQFIYDGEVLDLRVDDRSLTHLQIVIVNMLRRDHRFVFSWKDDVLHGDGRSSVWLHPNVSLRFTFSGSRVPSINRSWLEDLYATATSGSGLVLTPEPIDTSTAGDSAWSDAVVPGDEESSTAGDRE